MDLSAVVVPMTTRNWRSVCWILELIFAHLEPEVRARLHRTAVRGLKQGGALVLEAFAPEPGEFAGRQPGSETRLMHLDTLREELQGLRLVIARETQREISEGKLHQGRRSVVQVFGFRPAEPVVVFRPGDGPEEVGSFLDLIVAYRPGAKPLLVAPIDVRRLVDYFSEGNDRCASPPIHF